LADNITTDNVDFPLGLPPLAEGQAFDTFVVVVDGLLYRADLARIRKDVLTQPPGANALPNVALQVSAASVLLGGSVTLTATAADSDGTIAKVEFFDVTTKIGEVLGTGPYALAYTPGTAGVHSLTAKATDNRGASRITAPAALSVLAPGTAMRLPTPPAPTFADFDDVANTVRLVPSPGFDVASHYYRVGTTDAFRQMSDDDVLNVGNVAGRVYAYLGAEPGQHRQSPTAQSDAFTPAEVVVVTPPANTTPAAPVLTADDAANTLVASSPLGASEIVVSANGGAFAPYAGSIAVGDVDRVAGYYQFKIRAVTGRNESAVANSPAFTASARTVPTAPPTFDTTLTGPSSASQADGSHLTSNAGSLFKYNAHPLGATDPKRMDLLLPDGTGVGLLDYLIPYLGDLFSFQPNGSGTLYYGNHADGPVTLRLNP